MKIFTPLLLCIISLFALGNVMMLSASDLKEEVLTKFSNLQQQPKPIHKKTHSPVLAPTNPDPLVIGSTLSPTLPPINKLNLSCYFDGYENDTKMLGLSLGLYFGFMILLIILLGVLSVSCDKRKFNWAEKSDRNEYYSRVELTNRIFQIVGGVATAVVSANLEGTCNVFAIQLIASIILLASTMTSLALYVVKAISDLPSFNDARDGQGDRNLKIRGIIRHVLDETVILLTSLMLILVLAVDDLTIKANIGLGFGIVIGTLRAVIDSIFTKQLPEG